LNAPARWLDSALQKTVAPVSRSSWSLRRTGVFTASIEIRSNAASTSAISMGSITNGFQTGFSTSPSDNRSSSKNPRIPNTLVSAGAMETNRQAFVALFD
jgi:hypothetical protein